MNFRARNNEEEGRGGHGERRGLRFDPTIRASDILVIVSGLISIIYVWSSLDKRVALLEQSSATVQHSVEETRTDVKEVRKLVEERARRDTGR